MDFKKLLKMGVPAPLWRRAVAYLVDMAIVSFIILLPLQPVIDKYTKGSSLTEAYQFVQNNPQVVLQLLLISFAIAFLTVLYWAILEYNIRQSVGKMLCNIIVVPAKKPLRFGQCFWRNVTKCSSFFLFLDVVYMLFKGGHKRYFEVLSKTEVVVGGTNGKV